MRLRALSVTVAVAFQVAQGRLYESLESLPDRSYDFIVVGGSFVNSSVASVVLTNGNGLDRWDSRLCDSKQALREPPIYRTPSRGRPQVSSAYTAFIASSMRFDSNEGVLDLQVPGLTNNISTAYQWAYVTEPQANVKNRTLPLPRGHVLGGSSSINGMIYTRGSQDDYNAWAKITGDSAWSWDTLFSYAKKHEKWTAPVGGRDITGQYDPKVHGYDGRTRVSLRESPPDSFEARVLQTTKDLKEFPYNIDRIRDCSWPWTQSTIGNGERSSAATAFLDTPVRDRPNLDIVINTQATRVLRSGSGKQLDIRTVELGPRSGGSTRKTFTAAKEIILSAGSINTPQILLLSGIGPRAELNALGISAILDLPDVGKGMSDHSVGPFPRWNTTGALLQFPDPDSSLEQWKANRSGPMTEYGHFQIIWARIPQNSTVWKQHSDPSSGKNAPHIELYFSYDGASVGAAIILLTPKSRGSVTLRSTNPYDTPKIDLGYLSHPFDLEAIREGARIIGRFFAGPAWSGYVTAPLTVGPDDPGFDEQVRTLISSTWHPVGTAAMSAKGAKSGVLDPDLRVKNVKGLRVVDASAFPLIPTGHTQAGVYILAERAADLIKNSW
ncbi:hypothetical protein NMY22_g12382 [Coprinellus aureogranulatus]|nr:hypothetical protein NMY22_g12382 [Coprinellus aureogranulatus]